jgi:hypothetical protein
VDPLIFSIYCRKSPSAATVTEPQRPFQVHFGTEGIPSIVQAARYSRRIRAGGPRLSFPLVPEASRTVTDDASVLVPMMRVLLGIVPGRPVGGRLQYCWWMCDVFMKMNSLDASLDV